MASSGTQLDTISRQYSFMSTNDIRGNSSVNDKPNDEQQVEEVASKNEIKVSTDKTNDFFGSMVSVYDGSNQANG